MSRTLCAVSGGNWEVIETALWEARRKFEAQRGTGTASIERTANSAWPRTAYVGRTLDDHGSIGGFYHA